MFSFDDDTHGWEFSVDQAEGAAGTKIVYYSITSSRAGGAGSVVSRRYSDFTWLRDKLMRQYPGCLIAPLPKAEPGVRQALLSVGTKIQMSRTRAPPAAGGGAAAGAAEEEDGQAEGGHASMMEGTDDQDKPDSAEGKVGRGRLSRLGGVCVHAWLTGLPPGKVRH
jgi:hypothetical protein